MRLLFIDLLQINKKWSQTSTKTMKALKCLTLGALCFACVLHCTVHYHTVVTCLAMRVLTYYYIQGVGLASLAHSLCMNGNLSLYSDSKVLLLWATQKSLDWAVHGSWIMGLSLRTYHVYCSCACAVVNIHPVCACCKINQVPKKLVSSLAVSLARLLKSRSQGQNLQPPRRSHEHYLLTNQAS